MASMEHVKYLKKGVEYWNNWRNNNKKLKPDLSNYDFVMEGNSGACWDKKKNRVDLSNINFSNTNLSATNLKNARLMNANLSNANLTNSKLDNANLIGVDASKASFVLARARQANFRRANLANSDLSDAVLDKAILADSILENVNVSGVSINEADLSGTDNYFKNWKVSFLGKPSFPSNYFDVNISAVNGLTPFALRRLSDALYVKNLWKTDSWGRKILLRLWGISCSYGQNFFRWLFVSFALILIFSLILMNFEFNIATAKIIHQSNYKIIQGVVDYPSFGQALYFSVVTFTTLGFGDVLPVNDPGRFWVGFEVVIGYIMLGGLVSIFANKLARLA